jgi:hypothetical protein
MEITASDGVREIKYYKKLLLASNFLLMSCGCRLFRIRILRLTKIHEKDRMKIEG